MTRGVARALVFAACVLPGASALLTACATPGATVVRPARVAISDAAETLSQVQTLELTRIRTAAHAHLAACAETDRACRLAAVDAGFADEAPRIEAIHKLVETQHLLAEALTAYDACAANGNDQGCMADELARIRGLTPELRALADGLRKALAP